MTKKEALDAVFDFDWHDLYGTGLRIRDIADFMMKNEGMANVDEELLSEYVDTLRTYAGELTELAVELDSRYDAFLNTEE